MPAFDYVALDQQGQQQKGVLEGDGQRQVRQLLRDRGLVPLSVDESNRKVSTTGNRGRIVSPGIGVRDLALFTRQLATLVQAGLPLEESLAAVGQQTEKLKIRSIVMSVRSKVLEGFSLADSLADFPRAFPKLYRSTVSAGEHSGHLDIVLNRLADYTESSKESRQKLMGAMIYPALLLVVSISIAVFLMIRVVPGVVEVFQDTGHQLPILTRGLLALSHFVVNWGWLVLLLIIAAVFIVGNVLARPAMRLAFHRKLLSMPLVGKLIRNINTSQFASTLSILTSSGVPLVDAMRIASEVLGNLWLQVKVREATQMVSEGSSLRHALETAGYFPPMMLHMIASGESSGELDTM
ncbi:MAG TPA: type II secretion system inner membrane protein GspF, partial [Gemmatales bacterium]|nr:type II secretion system inner membrane protein GspF [Gemmatales bacterium]